MRYLKAGYYYVNMTNKVLRSCEDHTDYGDLVINFDIFSELGCDVTGDTVLLIINDKNKKASFVHFPAVKGWDSNKIYIDLYEVFDFDKVEPVVDDFSPEERIKQLEEEKKKLELEIKKQEKYDEVRKASNDIFICRQAIMDAGFSREEAMTIILSVLSGGFKSPGLLTSISGIKYPEW